MQETSKYAVGIDIGSTTVRCVIGHIDAGSGAPTIVGVGVASNSGMRKGVVANLTGPAKAIDDALGEAERMSGYQVNAATISINGSHILSTRADGMIAVGAPDHEINQEDLLRVEEVAITGKVPPNREVLDVVPHSYRLDGQDNIRDPLGMTGTRLEINANVISTLEPHIDNLRKAADLAKVSANSVLPSVIAASKAVLSESQMENGVAVLDMGGTTTSLAIYEEGDLQFVSVIPLGGVNITNDLAIGLKTDPEIAEKVKVKHATTEKRDDAQLTVKHGKENFDFMSGEVDEIVEARLDEIFEAIQAELKKAGRAGQLPSGVVITGGGSNLKGIVTYAKSFLGLAARKGASSGYGGVVDNLDKPEFAAAVGLMIADSEGSNNKKLSSAKESAADKVGKVGGLFSKFIDRFKP